MVQLLPSWRVTMSMCLSATSPGIVARSLGAGERSWTIFSGPRSEPRRFRVGHCDNCGYIHRSGRSWKTRSVAVPLRRWTGQGAAKQDRKETIAARKTERLARAGEEQGFPHRGEVGAHSQDGNGRYPGGGGGYIICQCR